MPYTDQFNRTDPFELNPIGIFDLWPRQAVWEARALLAEGRAVEDLKAIAASVEALIVNEASWRLRLSDGLTGSPVGGNPKAWVWPPDLNPQEAQQLRERHGDTNLYEAALASGQMRLPSSIAFEDWEGYAVIALWRLVDFTDALRAPRRRLHKATQARGAGNEPAGHLLGMPGVPQSESHEALRLAAPMLVEAVRACTLGTECRARAEQIAALKTRAQRDRALAIQRADTLRRQAVSEKARQSAAVTHQHLPALREQAWTLANSKAFLSRIDAARFAAEHIAKSDGAIDPRTGLAWYTERTVDAWLKARGWKAQPKPPGQNKQPRRRR